MSVPQPESFDLKVARVVAAITLNRPGRAMRIGLLLVVAACGGGTTVASDPEPAPDPVPVAKPHSSETEIAGTYSVFAGGGWSRGEASITRKGPAYQIVWTQSPEKSILGIGIRDGDRLLIGYDMKGGEVSVGVYKIDGDRLSARWISSEGGDRLGKETGTISGDGFEKGIHSVSGTDPSGAPYEGLLYVKAIGDGYRMWMMQGDERTRDGIALRIPSRRTKGGKPPGDMVVWAWGEGDSYGVGDYRIGADGDAMAGLWTRRGEYRAYWEVLSRRPGAADLLETPDGGPDEEEIAVYREYQREMAALGYALRSANQRSRNDCNVSAETVSEFISGGGDRLRDVLRRARAVKDRHRRYKWEDIPAPDAGSEDGLGSFDAARVRCVTSKRYSEALVEIERASLDDEQVDWIAVEVTVECKHAVPDVEHDIARPRMRRSRAVVKVFDATTAACAD